jgi:hypothetical protein
MIDHEKVFPLADPEGPVGQVVAEGLLSPLTECINQEYVLLLRATGDKIISLREHFDPTRSAKTLKTPILSLET